MELIFCGPIIFCSHYERKFQWNLRKRTNYSQIIWNKKTGNIYIIILLTEFKLSVILWYIFKNGFVVFHITLLTVEISSKKRKSPKKTSKKFYNVWFHAIRLFKFLFWHVLIYQDNFNPIVEGNCANLFMVVCWWIHNFGFCTEDITWFLHEATTYTARVGEHVTTDENCCAYISYIFLLL